MCFWGENFIGKINHWVNLLAEAQKISLWCVECLKETTKEKKMVNIRLEIVKSHQQIC